MRQGNPLNLTKQVQRSRSHRIRSSQGCSPIKNTRRPLKRIQSSNDPDVKPSQAPITHQTGPHIFNQLAVQPGKGNQSPSKQASPRFRPRILSEQMMRLEEENEDDLDDLDDLELANIGSR